MGWSLALSTVQCVARLLKLLLVCVIECLGCVAQLYGVAGFQFALPLPGVTLFVLFGRGLTHVFGGCFQMFCLYSVHHWLVTLVFGCGLCSTSFPGGHQVDSLPPASNHECWRKRPLDVVKWTPGGPKVCADAQW